MNGRTTGFAADRQVDAIELYKLGKVEKLVVTGDGASCKDGNVEVYLDQLERVWGVNREDVIIEPEALNTFQNIDYSLKLVPDMRSENTIVVNSAIYMRRTLLSCRKLDFYPAYYATDVNLSRKWTLAVVDSGLSCDGRMDATHARMDWNDCV